MLKNFTKSELKSDMVVQTKDGSNYVVRGKWLYGTSSVINIDHYQEDLTIRGMPWLDIVKIYSGLFFNKFLEEYSNDLIWQREEVKEVTMAEVEEKFGYKVKIIKDKNT